jgi:predicted dehydrogenase
MVLKVGIIGCGVIGTKRSHVINSSSDSKVIAVADVDLDKAKSLGSQLNCTHYADWRKIVTMKEIDAVVISTTNNHLAKISYEAALHGKHVFCEKPLGVNVDEVRTAIDEAIKQKVVFKTGFTLRFHPGIQKMKSVIDQGLIGKILFIRCRYGITGRPGYEKEWRSIPEISGGGELIDQGIHVLDLCRWFLGNFSSVCGTIGTLYWNTKVEDNAFAILSTPSNQIASLHVSWTQWNNIFSFEIFGDNGYAILEGLGGAYGTEKLVLGKKAPPDKWPPEENVTIFDHPEICWNDEWNDFTSSIKNNTVPCGSGIDGLEALHLVFQIYDSSKKNNRY